ncbi:sulfatase [Cyclobacterium sp. SYSU L10401]|uniref:sulfatase n=1 Tax=Cyclobacterium sp. SYSU L10401 TaxID=2678657 RepID=UPI0013D66C5E|nr:sulfatase [Cyclobacterium sp. SYSU L10401]
MTFKNMLPLFAALLMVSCQQEQAEQAEKQKPNILFILADDLGYHDLSCMGSDYYETPNIDRIANEGMVFTNGYATCQVCSPSRASLMSGKFPARHGITDWIGAKTGEAWREAGRFNKLLPPENKDHLEHEYTTLPEAMKEAGYTTFFAGKWHLGGEGSYPEDHGFDINQGGFEQGGPYTGGYYSPFNNPKMEDHEDEVGMSLSMKLAKETAKFITDNKDTTFFAYLSFYAVHSPIQTSKEKWSKYRQKAEEAGIAETGFKMAHFLPIRQEQDNPVYAGLVETMDDAVGHVLQTLDELGLDDNTIVIFTSDNGGVSAGDAFATSNLPLRGGKGYQYEGGILEPYFIKTPFLDNAGKTSDAPVTGTDFYPTLLELIGAELKPEEHADGVSLVPLLTGGTIEERPLIWHYPHYGNQGGEPSSIIRRGEWKLIHYYEDGREELYNLEEDLEENHDVAAENSELAGRLSEQLFAYLDEVGALYPKKDPMYDPAKEQEYLDRVRNVRMPALEKQRMEFLSRDFDPGNQWWGSDVGN